MKKYTGVFDIDLVYLWVDGKDPRFLEKKQKFLDRPLKMECRHQNNNELLYSLRSVEKYIPWVRNIFIVTDNQIPSFVDTNNPRIKIIDQNDILPEDILPVFNSVVIEYFLYKIPDLSEHFLYANDDMFVNAVLSPSFFFDATGNSIVRMKYEPMQRLELKLKEMFKIKVNPYRQSIRNAATIFKREYGVYYAVSPHHNIDALLKSDCKAIVEDAFRADIENILKNRFRDKSDIQRIIMQYYMLKHGHGIMKYVGRRESCRIPLQKPDYMKYIQKYHPKLFCLNDTEHATDEDRDRIKPFLEKLFPEKSSFEK